MFWPNQRYDRRMRAASGTRFDPLGVSPYQASAVHDLPVCRGKARNVANYIERNQSPLVRLSFGTTI